MSETHLDTVDMDEDDRRTDATLKEELSFFGLSDTEINTYLAVLGSGEATASDIAGDAGVTQRAVYNIAERLEDRGLVRVNSHASPTTVRALPPSEAIENLSGRLESITPALERRFTETEPQAPEILVVKSKQTALKRLRRAITQAEHEIFVAVPEKVYPEIESELREAVERGLFVLLLLGDTDAEGVSPNRYTGAATAVRWWGESLPFLYTADDRSSMIGDSGLLSGAHTDEDAVSVDQENLTGSIVGLYLSGYWPAATELLVSEGCSLPRTFDWFRTATFNAIRHRQAGTPLVADIETEDGTRVSGPVVEVRQALVEPATNDFTLENSLLVETDDGVVSIGGQGSFIEDYRAEKVTLRTNQ